MRRVCQHPDRLMQNVGKIVEQFWFELGDISGLKGISGTKIVGIVDKGSEE